MKSNAPVKKGQNPPLMKRISAAIPRPFLFFRACVYVLVLLWSMVCLAIAAHFQAVLTLSDLTHFVPFAIFVSVASFVVILTVLAFSIRRNMNPVSTRLELACLGLVGTFWLALGAFLVSSDSEDADVECFTSDSDETLVDDPSFTTETYQAQYRVLEAFSLFNVILIWSFAILLFFLSLRLYLRGTRQIWLVPVTAVNWFGTTGNGKPTSNKKSSGGTRLPPPVTARQKSIPKPSAAIAAPTSSRRAPETTEKPVTRPPHKRENSDAPVYHLYTDKPRPQQQQSSSSRPQPQSQSQQQNQRQRSLDRNYSGRTERTQVDLQRDRSGKTERSDLTRGLSGKTAVSRDLSRDRSGKTSGSRDLSRDRSGRTERSRDLARDQSGRTGRTDLSRDRSGRTERSDLERGRSGRNERSRQPGLDYWRRDVSPRR